ncbi:hypothetical protein [Yoonia vestfoldensis]|uniref:hypothetical protein n=1 Tax=Yoonia vestfoldensis TaxID=245188 RepID=UPI0013A545E8|nr:hypothetical protein [Yoonia vestfoldensis]
MEEPKFKTSDVNPLPELSGVRVELEPTAEFFELKCRLLFAVMRYEHQGREYEVGVTRAYLRLSLEGCETVLGSSFGENVLASVVEENSLEKQAGFVVSGGISAGSVSGVNVNLGGRGEVGVSKKQKISETKTHLPVIARPNDSWEVLPQVTSAGRAPIIDGTAIPSIALCTLRRKKGGNRMVVIGEVQVSKRSIKVSAVGGNLIGK